MNPSPILLLFMMPGLREIHLCMRIPGTMPNLENFAQKALVYHRHYAGGNFIVPGTASLLTGVYPWKH